MPCLLALGLGAAIWLGLRSQDRQANPQQPPASAAPPSPTLASPTQASPAPADQTPDRPPLIVAVAAPRAQALATAAPVSAADHNTAFKPLGDEPPMPLRLRLEARWAAPTQRGSTQAPTANTLSTIRPHLKPETWLHSKEP